MKRLSIIDSAFLVLESRETPMHVGGLNLFNLPEGADEQQFLHGLADGMRTSDDLQSPFGDKLKVGRLGVMGRMYWEPDTALDLDYHIRHSALPRPGRFRELSALVSRIHDSPLSAAARDRYVAGLGRLPPSDAQLRNVAESLKATFDSSAHVYGAMKRFTDAWLGRGGALKLPWMEVPRSSINTSVDGARRFVAQS